MVRLAALGHTVVAADPCPELLERVSMRPELPIIVLQRLLSPDEQAAVHLCYQQGLSHSEIAAGQFSTLATYRSRRGRKAK